MTMPPTVGAPAPDFKLPADGGAALGLSDFAGRPLVLYFYPKDDTPTCTTQAKDFTAAAAEFEAAGVAIVGVSKDSAKKHAKFRAKHGLAFPLLSDEDSDLCERYGVWAEKSMYGKTYMGIVRTTFLIDASGKIAQIWKVAKVKDHVAEVLAAAKAL